MKSSSTSLFNHVECLICTCCQLPLYGNFTVGEDYSFEHIIDAVRIVDNLGEVIIVPESIFARCFGNYIKAVTSVCNPILEDTITYHIYIILAETKCSLEEIKACAAILNMNYLQARELLRHKRNFIMSGDAYQINKILGKLAHFQVHYEVEPEYPYKNIIL